MPFTVGILAQCHLCNRLPILRKRLHHLPIGILNAIFSPTGTLSPARRIVNRVTSYSSPAVSPGILPFAASNLAQCNAQHRCRTPA